MEAKEEEKEGRVEDRQAQLVEAPPHSFAWLLVAMGSCVAVIVAIFLYVLSGVHLGT